MSYDEMEFAKKENLDVIVLDHHQPEITLPAAYAIVNPNRLDDTSNLNYLAAVGVTYFFLIALNRKLRSMKWFANNDLEEPNMMSFLDIIALGTICDAVPLRGINRLLVIKGIEVMKKLTPFTVNLSVNDNVVAVKGNKGELDFSLPSSISIDIKDDVININYNSEDQESVALAGTTRSILNNMVVGVSEGFEKKLELIGVGYRAKASGKLLELTLGFSHPIKYQLPDEVEVETPSQTEVILRSHNKQILGQAASEIRAFRPPEPYKGKGVRYSDEQVKRKEAKKAAGAGAV